MNTQPKLTAEHFEQLRALDTCTVSNAIERRKVRLRNEGFIAGAVRCRFPSLGPMLGYAVTARIRSSLPPVTGQVYYDHIGFWRFVESLPKPVVMVMQDIDPRPGFGALMGKGHALIASAMGCIGYVSNGSVRHLPAVKALGLHLFSGSLSVSHAYAHILEFGHPVEIGGLRIATGDLVHGDLNGVHTIPLEIADAIPDEAAQLLREENELEQFCRSPEFSVDRLERRLREMTRDSL